MLTGQAIKKKISFSYKETIKYYYFPKILTCLLFMNILECEFSKLDGFFFALEWTVYEEEKN